jgi:hypothetical protein
MKKKKHRLFDDYTVEITTDEKEFMKYFRDNRDLVFSENTFIQIEEILSENEKEKLSKLNRLKDNNYKLRLYILKGNIRIGWFLGEQISRETFYMRNTGIFKEYRNKGVYTRLLFLLIEILREEGFLKITSSHIVTNNNVIVPKLKAGFLISGFEISDRFGLFINLTYNFIEMRNKIMRYRTGEIAADEQLTQLLNLNKNK